MRYLFLFVLIVMICASCSKQPKQEMKLAADDTLAISEDSLLTLVQYQTFQYFWDNAEKTSGLGKERTHMDNIYPDHDQTVVTTGGSGFGIMAILVGI
ncbi:MAG TPA: beta-glucosidase, partial [Cyclobacteriaceae bacterium]|nr:beta-glucosidase [Cyclobacteriaceae bacterium]